MTYPSLFAVAAIAVVQSVSPEPSATPTASAIGLAPSGKWVMEYNEDACVMARSFGPASHKITFGFKPDSFATPDRADVELILIDSEPKLDEETGSATVSVLPAGRVFKGAMRAGSVKSGLRAYIIYVKDLTISDLAKFNIVEVTFLDKVVYRLRVGVNAAALGALNTCRDSFVKSVGADVDVAHSVVTPAEPINNKYQWIDVSDYPASKGFPPATGVTTILWTISLDGRATNCRTILSSGHKKLDEAACNAITRNARYKPARNIDGVPVTSYQTREVFWAGSGMSAFPGF